MIASCVGNKPIAYPDAERQDIADDYFGTSVPDPYRWLENDTSAETTAWVEAENAITNDYLARIPFREALKQRMTELQDYEKIGLPFKKYGKYYSYRNSGLQNQSVLYVQDSLDGEARLVLDPNTLSDDGTVALQNVNFSHDGRYMAYVISRSGSDWNEIFVIDLSTGKQLDDHIVWAKFTDAQWLGDGFFYSAYDAPSDGKELSAKNEFQKVYYHKIGTPQSADRLEYMNPKFPLRFYSVGVSDDETYMVLVESEGHGNNLYVNDLRRPGSDYVLVHDNIKDEFYAIGNVGSRIFCLTNSDAPMRKVVCIDLDNLKKGEWTTLVPEDKSVIADAQLAADKLLITYEKDAASHPMLFGLDGARIKEIELPTLGSAYFVCDKDDPEAFFSITSFTMPSTIYRYDVSSDTSSLLRAPKTAFNPDEFTTEQVTYKSADGTEVKMFLTYRKDLERNGKNPVLLYGYGGFNISLNPSFSAIRIPFIENGGIFAMANLRGGGEYGEEWHQAGTKMNKQNVFDDFIAAAEYLVDNKYTSPEHIAINGGSNGGLLVGAVVNQRPDLFRVAVPQVGVMDMLRYHKFTIGWNWAGDYGTSDDSQEMFKYLLDYSPLHNIKNDGTQYPAILVTTADHDDRVVPAHSFKYAATLQYSNTGNRPKLIRIDSKAGHGGGKPMAKIIEEYSDIYSFVMYNLGVEYKKP
ncbi:MAG: prolyl oligopeptidase family serine peptidase [Muribaculaceae bacterium]|nr:prolyl oligopeptidase family serine peptidase [Muribaculaceae bacterium]